MTVTGDADADEDPEYVVERLLSVKLGKHPQARGVHVLFLVKWQDYDAPEWWPLSTVKDLAALDDFLRTAEWHDFRKSPAYKVFCADPKNKRRMVKLH